MFVSAAFGVKHPSTNIASGFQKAAAAFHPLDFAGVLA
jgi:hypothetical protein